jgi:hypothetical protein
MKPGDKAEELVNQFRIVLMNEDTDCGNEVLCTLIAQKQALITVDEIVKAIDNIMIPNPFKQYWNKVKQETLKL